jgi:hypothetical protein
MDMKESLSNLTDEERELIRNQIEDKFQVLFQFVL